VEQQKDVAASETLMNAIDNYLDPFESRSVARALSALAVINSQEDDRSRVRSYIERFLASPRQSIQVGAIRALGELRDPTTFALISSFIVEGSQDRLSEAASDALKKLHEQAPLVPAEVSELRKLIQAVKEENEKLKKDVEDLKSRVNKP
jgi:HEAT repeat protein